MDNIYIKNIIEYASTYTPIILEIDYKHYELINTRIEKMSTTKKTKELIVAIYTLFYTSVNLHKKVKDIDNGNLSYYILLADYIYSYCTQILYSNQEHKMLKIFASHSKKVVLDILDDQNTDYFLEILLDNIEN